MGFGIGPIKLPSPSSVVNAVKDVVVDKVSDAVDTAQDVAKSAVDVAEKAATGPLGVSKLGLEIFEKGAKTAAKAASSAAGEVADALSDLVTPNHDDETLEAGGRGRVASYGDGNLI